MCPISITQKLAPFGFAPGEPEYFSEREHETDSAIILAEFPEILLQLSKHRTLPRLEPNGFGSGVPDEDG